jgi:hypothetical protein
VRTLLVVVTLLCICMGWQFNWIRQREAERQRITAAGQWIMRNGTTFRDGRPFPAITYHVGLPRHVPWPLRIFGEQGETAWILDMPDQGPEIERVRKLFPEATIVGRPRSEPWQHVISFAR